MKEMEDKDASEIFYDVLDYGQEPLKPSWREQVPQQFQIHQGIRQEKI
jgi:hypothetical protein